MELFQALVVIGCRHLVEAGRVLGRVGGQGAVEGSGDGGEVEGGVVTRDGVDDAEEVPCTWSSLPGHYT